MSCSVPETLRAAHIIDYRESRTNTVTNGLLLRADTHPPFDHFQDEQYLEVHYEKFRRMAS